MQQSHIKQVTSKANRTKGFLQHNLHNYPPETKSKYYKAMVKTILDYAATVWSPHTQKDINTIERSQRQAARFVLNNFSTYASVLQMLTNLNWSILAHCRAKSNYDV